MPDPRDTAAYHLLLAIAQAIAARPDEVFIEADWEDDGATFTIRASRQDLSRIIGEYSLTLDAIRALIRGTSMKVGRRYSIFVEQ